MAACPNHRDWLFITVHNWINAEESKPLSVLVALTGEIKSILNRTTAMTNIAHSAAAPRSSTDAENRPYLRITQATIHGAVSLWCASSQRHQVLAIYGPIEDWDVSEVTNMARLLWGNSDFT